MRLPALPDLVTLALVLVPLAGAAFMIWPRSTERRQCQVEKWAHTNLATLTPDITAALNKALTSRDRLGGVALTLVAAGALPLAFMRAGRLVTTSAVWTLLIVAALVATLAAAWRLARPWFGVGPTRWARTRAVSLNDYVFPPVRWIAWLTCLVCLMASVTVLLSPKSVAGAAMGAGPSIGVAAAVAVAEWNGRRAARLSQPARDAVELYALDAWRCHVAGAGFQLLALWGAQVMAFTSTNYVANTVAAALLQLAGWGLLVVFFLARRFPAYSITWMRHRLWPSLRDGETVETEVVTL